MKKKTKTVTGVILAVVLVAVLVVVGVMTYLGITWTNNHEFGEYVGKEGPWGTTDKWFSSDSKSYLECVKENEGDPVSSVTAYFEIDGQWCSFELHYIDRIAYFETVVDGATTETEQGKMKFDGTQFTIYDLDEKVFGNDRYAYFQSHIIAGYTQEPANYGDKISTGN